MIAQEDVFAEYQATARTTLRFAWFTDFTGFMCKQYAHETDMTMAQVSKNAYNDNLGNHHNWFV